MLYNKFYLSSRELYHLKLQTGIIKYFYFGLCKGIAGGTLCLQSAALFFLSLDRSVFLHRVRKSVLSTTNPFQPPLNINTVKL